PKPPTAPTAPPAVGGRTVTLQAIEFRGNHAIPTAELNALAQDYLNRPLTGDDLADLRHHVTLYYVNKGYISSGAKIEKQSITDGGTLLVEIVEGELTRVQVTDNTAAGDGKNWRGSSWMPPLNDSYYADRLLADNHLAGLIDGGDQALNTRDLQERYLLLLNDPLVRQLNGTLLPGLKRGEAVLDLKVVRARPYGAYLEANNFSPPSVGGYAGRIGGWVRNLSGFGETVNFDFITTGGSNTYNTGIDIPLSARGTRFAFRYTNSENTLIEAPFDTLDVNSNIISYDGQLSQVLWRNLQQAVTWGLNFNIRQDRTTIAGAPFNRPGASDGQTQETVVRNWFDYVHQRREFDVALRTTFSVGVDALGATITNQVGDGRFFAWLGQGYGRYWLPHDDTFIPDGASVSLSGAVQVTDDKLLPLEKMAIGGVYTVRGYRQNYLVRDEGFYASLQLSYPLYRLWGGEWNARRNVSAVPFFSYGGAWDYEEKGDYVSSTGLGLEARYDNFSGSVYWAQRLDSYRLTPGTPYDLQDNGVTFQVRWESQ
ncbi:MAG: ShlB/FhaC/HecB family hemolysin secretion/activation protein, partial [Candidatus Methylumidiphilus sp.]